MRSKFSLTDCIAAANTSTAVDVEGIFRLAGSEKRIKELKAAFDSPDRYGKGLDWTGYTVHDAANILRRYFNQLPEPIIPLDFYPRFREPLKHHLEQMASSGQQGGENFQPESAIRRYQVLITELPPLNRQLLLYILDLLAVFASKSDLNKMTTANLAAIFQPGILSHPSHDMAPQEYRLSQDVLVFLIENQDSFLIGMQGTEADAETVRNVQSGTPTPGTPTTPNRSKTVVGRTASNASAGAESVRKWGNIRRNVSVSSKHSKRSEAGPVPVTPVIGSPTTPTSGVHRSNTVPSRRAGSTNHSPRFSRDKHSDPPTPSPGMVTTAEEPAPNHERHGSIQSTPTATSAPPFPQVPPTEVTSASSSEATTPMAAIVSDGTSIFRSDYMTPKKDTTPLLAPPPGSGERNPDRSVSGSTASTRGFLDIFKQSPTSDDGRKPNKLQKKRIPGSSLSSAQSSTHSLGNDAQTEMGPRASPKTPGFTSEIHEAQGQRPSDQSAYATAHTSPVQPTPQRNPTDATLKPAHSPTRSYHSTDFSDGEKGDDDMPPPAAGEQQRERRRHRWRFSRSQNKLDPPQSPDRQHDNPFGTMTARELTTSRSTVGSSNDNNSQPRRSFHTPAPLGTVGTQESGPSQPLHTGAMQSPSTDPVFSDSEREKKGPMSWIRGKIQERKEKDAEKRAKTPERNRDRSSSKQDLKLPNEAIPAGGKSLETQRAQAQQQVQQAQQGLGGGASQQPMPQQSSGSAYAQVPAQQRMGGNVSPQAYPSRGQQQMQPQEAQVPASTPPAATQSAHMPAEGATQPMAPLSNGASHSRSASTATQTTIAAATPTTPAASAVPADTSPVQIPAAGPTVAPAAAEHNSAASAGQAPVANIAPAQAPVPAEAATASVAAPSRAQLAEAQEQDAADSEQQHAPVHNVIPPVAAPSEQ